MSKKKSGVSPQQRDEILRGHGFELARDAKGSHAIWEHPGLKMLERTRKIEAPALICAPGQAAWKITVPDNPAPATWKSIVKQAAWCQQTVAGIEENSVYDRQRLALARDFRKAAATYAGWKKDVHHRLRAGLAPQEPPVTFRQLQDMKSQLKPATP